jgi:hypothetical protein
VERDLPGRIGDVNFGMAASAELLGFAAGSPTSSSGGVHLVGRAAQGDPNPRHRNDPELPDVRPWRGFFDKIAEVYAKERAAAAAGQSRCRSAPQSGHLGAACRFVSIVTRGACRRAGCRVQRATLSGSVSG